MIEEEPKYNEINLSDQKLNINNNKEGENKPQQNGKVNFQEEIRKLISGYSRKGSDSFLTNEQFIELINDVMSTIDYPQLNPGQI